MGLILAMLCGCGQRQSVSAEKETDRIVIWTWDDTFNVKAAKLAAKEYKKTHKDIQIIVETKNLIASKMYQELPDVIMIEDYDIQDVLSQYEDEFVDLTDKVDYDRYTDYKSKLCSKGDRFYGIPFDSGTAALFYFAERISFNSSTSKWYALLQNWHFTSIASPSLMIVPGNDT